jgi:hypothetical protein
MNPNVWEDEPDTWQVCATCDEAIKLQRRQTFGAMCMSSMEESAAGFGEKMYSDATKELEALSARTGKPTFGAVIRKLEGGSLEAKELK